MEEEQSSDSLYLQQLTFQEKDWKTWLAFFIRNFRVTVLIIIGLLVWGAFSYVALPLESNPEVKVPFGIVTVALPGASPADMEELVIKKIEDRVVNLSGVKQVSATALNSFASISVEFRAEEDITDAIRRLRDAVEDVRNELPADAGDPSVQEVSFSNQPIWSLVVTGPYDNFTLRHYAELVQDELELLPGTSRVLISGGDVNEIRITYDPAKLQQYGLSAFQVNDTIRATNITFPLGTIDVSQYEYTVRADAKFYTAETIRALPISTRNGSVIRLRDIAVVAERAQERPERNYFSLQGSTPQNAVSLNIVKKTGSSIVDLIDDGKARIKTLSETVLPDDVHVETTLDFSTIIRRDFDQLVHDGLLTILVVSLIVFLFVGLKEAFVAGLAVPLVFAATFGLMRMFGITLNFLSLFSLILSLGMLVDDAIVVVQATKQYLKTGKFTPEEAVLLVFHDFKVLLTTTTLTTIWAFLPLLLASGIIGQFIKSIPVTVSVTLASSYVIAIIINHPMAIILERFRVTRSVFISILIITGAIFVGLTIAALGGPSGMIPVVLATLAGALFLAMILWYRRTLRARLLQNEHLIIEERADPAKIKAKIHHHYRAASTERGFFDRMINGVIKVDPVLKGYGALLMRFLVSTKRSVAVLLIVAILFFVSVALPVTGILRSEFIPASDSEYLYVNIKGAPGLLTPAIEEVADEIEQILLAEPTIYSFSKVIGSAGVDMNDDSPRGTGGQTNRAQFALNLFPLASRPESPETGEIEKSYEIAPRLRAAIASVRGAQIDVVELANGPPSGADFEARITGEDLTTLEHEALRLQDVLGSIPGTVNEKTSLDVSPGEFTLAFDYNQMQLKGVSASQIGALLRMAVSGSEVTKVLRDGEDVIVRAEFDPVSVGSIDALQGLPLVNNQGQSFRLGDIADVSLGSSLTTISRIDQKRVVVLSASVEQPYLPADVLAEFQARMTAAPLPSGYQIAFGGQNETNQESIFSIFRAMILAMLLIIATLVIQFNSFKKSVLVLATIPLAVTGVFYGFTLTGFTLTFPALIGILALFGIVVKNAVILIDKISLNLKVGIPFREAIVDASQSRLEAIFLTSLSTVMGMIPITLSNETWRGLGLALIFGLSSATLLTLLVIPILYRLTMYRSYQKEQRVRELQAALTAPVALETRSLPSA